MRININNLTNKINSVITEVNNIIDSLNDGERIKITDLSEKVGERLNVDGDEILGIINYIAHNLEGVYTKKGRTGGMFKGTEEVKNT
jgi:hypothetical protein